MEHFSEVLNRPPPPTEADIQEAETDLDVNTDSPGKEEIIAAIKSLKNGKLPGQDNLSTEVFKADPQLAADLLQPLFADIWEGMKLPEDWTERVIVKIPKKGALNNCNNWRGITLISVLSQILAKIITQRIADTVDHDWSVSASSVPAKHQLGDLVDSVLLSPACCIFCLAWKVGRLCGSACLFLSSSSLLGSLRYVVACISLSVALIWPLRLSS